MDRVARELKTSNDLFATLLDVTGMVVQAVEASGVREHWEARWIGQWAALSPKSDCPAVSTEEPDQEPLIFCTDEVMAEVDASLDRMVADLLGDPKTTPQITENLIDGAAMVADELGHGPEAANVIIGTLALKLATAIQRLAAADG